MANIIAWLRSLLGQSTPAASSAVESPAAPILAEPIPVATPSIEIPPVVVAEAGPDPKAVRALRVKGRAELLAGNFDAARVLFEEALALDPENEDLQKQLEITATREKAATR